MVTPDKQNILGTIYPGGPNWLGTIFQWGPNFWGPFVHGYWIGWGPFVQRYQSIRDQLWGTTCVWDQMCRSRRFGSGDTIPKSRHIDTWSLEMKILETWSLEFQSPQTWPATRYGPQYQNESIIYHIENRVSTKVSHPQGNDVLYWMPSSICKSYNLEQDDCPLFMKTHLKLPNIFLPLWDLQIPLGNVSFVVGVFCSKCTHSLMYFQDTK